MARENHSDPAPVESPAAGDLLPRRRPDRTWPVAALFALVALILYDRFSGGRNRPMGTAPGESPASITVGESHAGYSEGQMVHQGDPLIDIDPACPTGAFSEVRFRMPSLYGQKHCSSAVISWRDFSAVRKEPAWDARLIR
jgi:hypothetical protein